MVKISLTTQGNGKPFPAEPLIIIKFVTRFIYNQLHIILNMENIKTIAFRGSSDLIGNLQLCIDHISYAIPNIMNSDRPYKLCYT